MSSPLWRAVEEAHSAGDDSLDALRIYADWLQAEGDPHGELIALGCALYELEQAKDDADPRELVRLRRVYQECQKRLEPQLFGTSLDSMAGLRYHLERGFLHHLYVDIQRQEPRFLAELASRRSVALLRDLGFGFPLSRDRNTDHPSVSEYLDATAPCRHVRTLSLEQVTLDGPALRRVAALTGLQRLYLHRCHIDPDVHGDTWLARLTELCVLGLWCVEVPSATTASLSELPRLQELHMRFPSQQPEACFTDVLQLSARERVYLDFHDEAPAQFFASDPALLAPLSSHDHLSISIDAISLPAQVYTRLAELSSLRELDLWHLDLTPALCGALAPARRLESLSIRFCPEGDQDAIDALPTLPALTCLELSENSWLSGAALRYLDRIPRLRELHISECLPLTREQVQRIAAQHSLHTLELVDCEGLRPGALEPLGDLHELRSLELGMMPDVTPKDLHFIGALSDLRSLDLWEIAVDEELIAVIAHCQDLRDLSLHAPEFPEEWLPLLQSLPFLARFSLSCPNISDDQANRLRTVLPGCRVVVWLR